MKRKRNIILSVFAVLLVGVTLLAAAAAGGADDPVISLSYLNNVFKPQLKTEIASDTAAAIEAAKPGIVSETKQQVLAEVGNGSSAFVPLMLTEGQTLYPNGGSVEVLLRRGAFSCVDTAEEGIVNLTSGLDQTNGEELSLQNLYLIPRDDGRGIRATASTECWVMVRGAYRIEG